MSLPANSERELVTQRIGDEPKGTALHFVGSKKHSTSFCAYAENTGEEVHVLPEAFFPVSLKLLPLSQHSSDNSSA